MSAPTPPRRIALVLEYDGSGYVGSQIQKRGPTIQAELESSLQQLTGERVRIAFAGRTDAGVHAQGQVAAFSTTATLETDVFVRGLNAWLPNDIAVRRAFDVPEEFDPRRHAASRTYRYLIYNSPVRSPLHHERAWYVAEPLDDAAMQEAAAHLLGEHDFAAFSRREGVRTVRCLQRCDLERQGPLLTAELQANAFLRQQVRRTVGALVQVGTGRLSIRQFHQLLEGTEPGSAGPQAPAHALCLLKVEYPALDLCAGNTLS